MRKGLVAGGHARLAPPEASRRYDAAVTRSGLERDVEILAALQEPTRLRLYRLVERAPAPVSRDISRSLAAFHLDRLTKLRLLSTEYRRLTGRTGPGAGRTAKLYRRSKHVVQISLPHRDHELLARILSEAFGSGLTELVAVEPARDAGRSLGSRARQRLRGKPGSERLLQCGEDILESLGFDPYRTSPSEVRLRNCPFAPLARTFEPLVCGIGMSLVEGIADGVDGNLDVERDFSPDRCCPVLRAGDGGSAGLGR